MVVVRKCCNSLGSLLKTQIRIHLFPINLIDCRKALKKPKTSIVFTVQSKFLMKTPSPRAKIALKTFNRTGRVPFLPFFNEMNFNFVYNWNLLFPLRLELRKNRENSGRSSPFSVFFEETRGGDVGGSFSERRTFISPFNFELFLLEVRRTDWRVDIL